MLNQIDEMEEEKDEESSFSSSSVSDHLRSSKGRQHDCECCSKKHLEALTERIGKMETILERLGEKFLSEDFQESQARELSTFARQRNITRNREATLK